MGEARKRRLALIKEGKAEEARRPENNPTPQDLTLLSVLVTKKMYAEILKRREVFDPEHAYGFGAFCERLLMGGMAHFDLGQAQKAEQDSLIKIAGPKEMSEVSRRLQAARPR